MTDARLPPAEAPLRQRLNYQVIACKQPSLSQQVFAASPMLLTKSCLTCSCSERPSELPAAQVFILTAFNPTCPASVGERSIGESGPGPGEACGRSSLVPVRGEHGEGGVDGRSCSGHGAMEDNLCEHDTATAYATRLLSRVLSMLLPSRRYRSQRLHHPNYCTAGQHTTEFLGIAPFLLSTQPSTLRARRVTITPHHHRGPQSNGHGISACLPAVLFSQGRFIDRLMVCRRSYSVWRHREVASKVAANLLVEVISQLPDGVRSP